MECSKFIETEELFLRIPVSSIQNSQCPCALCPRENDTGWPCVQKCFGSFKQEKEEERGKRICN